MRDLDQQQLTFIKLLETIQESKLEGKENIKLDKRLLHSIHLVVIKHTTQARMGPGLKAARTHSSWPALYIITIQGRN